MLVRKGRIDLGRPVAAWRREVLETDIVEVPLDGASAVLSQDLPDLHPNPADRLILASAIMLRATLLTSDRKLLAWPGSLPRLDAAR